MSISIPGYRFRGIQDYFPSNQPHWDFDDHSHEKTVTVSSARVVKQFSSTFSPVVKQLSSTLSSVVEQFSSTFSQGVEANCFPPVSGSDSASCLTAARAIRKNCGSSFYPYAERWCQEHFFGVPLGPVVKQLSSTLSSVVEQFSPGVEADCLPPVSGSDSASCLTAARAIRENCGPSFYRYAKRWCQEQFSGVPLDPVVKQLNSTFSPVAEQLNSTLSSVAEQLNSTFNQESVGDAGAIDEGWVSTKLIMSTSAFVVVGTAAVVAGYLYRQRQQSKNYSLVLTYKNDEQLVTELS